MSFRVVNPCLYDLRRPTCVPKLCLAAIQQEAVMPWGGGGTEGLRQKLGGHPSSTTCRVVTRDAGGLSGIPVTLLVTRARSDYEPP